MALLFIGCSSNYRPKEIKMTENDKTMCLYMADVVYHLAEYQKAGHPKKYAITEAIKNRGKTGGGKELENYTYKLVSGRADVVYAIPEFNPQSFRFFEWSVCKMGSLHGWQLEYSKMEEIRDKIIECQNLTGNLQKHQFCVEGVVYSYVK